MRDIVCLATHREFQQAPEHDGRIATLVMRNVDNLLSEKLEGQAVIFDLPGVAGGAWKVGPGKAAATIQMDVLDFNNFASGRFAHDKAIVRATLSGDSSLAELALKNTLVLY